MQGNPLQETSSAQFLVEGELGETGQDDVDLRTHPIAQAKGVWSMRLGASQPRCALRSGILAGKQLARSLQLLQDRRDPAADRPAWRQF